MYTIKSLSTLDLPWQPFSPSSVTFYPGEVNQLSSQELESQKQLSALNSLKLLPAETFCNNKELVTVQTQEEEEAESESSDDSGEDYIARSANMNYFKSRFLHRDPISHNPLHTAENLLR